jgi:peroxiredoxin Q/BCP
MPATPELLIGDPAPDFRAALLGDDPGKLALCFYPADDLPGAITQLTGMRDVWHELRKLARVVAVSADAPEAQQRLISLHALPFALLSDPGDAVAKAYGLWLGAGGGGDVEGCSPTERATFVIDPAGRIEAILRGFSPGAHAARLLELLQPC